MTIPKHWPRALAIVAEDGTNEAMLNTHGVDSKTLDALVAADLLRFELRRYGARGNRYLDLTVRRFFLTPTGRDTVKQRRLP